MNFQCSSHSPKREYAKWWLILPAVALVGGSIWALTRPSNSGGTRTRVQTAKAIHGEAIASLSNASNQIIQAASETNARSKRYPQPGSTQKRMVMFEMQVEQLADEQPVSNLPPATGLITGPKAGQPIGPMPDGYLGIGFDKLASFNFVLTDQVVNGLSKQNPVPAAPHNQIPEDIQKLDGRKVGIQGFLLPVKMDDGLAVEFLLMRDRSFCCYGTPPKINQWITVRLKGRGVKPVMDQVITVFGTLHVGEIRENGFLAGLYELDAEKVAGLAE